MSNYTVDTLYTFMSAYADGSREALEEGAADFIEAYGLVFSQVTIDRLVHEYRNEHEKRRGY